MKIFFFLKTYFKKYINLLIIYVFLCILTNVSSVLLPHVVGNFLDCLILSSNKAFIVYNCFIYLSVNVLIIVTGYLSTIIYTKVQSNIAFEINRDVLLHIKDLSLLFFENTSSVYLNQRVNQDSNIISVFCIHITKNVIVNILMFIVPFYLMTMYNKGITIILLIIVIIYIIIYSLCKKPLYNRNLIFKETQNLFFTKLNEQISQIRFIKINAVDSVFIKRLDDSFKKYFNVNLSYQKIFCLLSSLEKMIVILSQIALFILGGMEVVNNNLSVGQLTAVSSYFNIIVGSIGYFFNLGKSYQDAYVSYNRIEELMTMKQENNGVKEINEIIEISAINLNFQYNNKKVIDNQTFTIRKNEITCISGSNGSGKTTLLKLLLGIYVDNYKGNIFYNRTNLQEINMKNVRRNLIGVAEQDPIMIADTLMYNITLGEQIINIDNRMEKIINILGLNEFLNSLPNGFDTLISENSTNLSGGERQKLSILRVLLKNPDVIVLDEPSNALDNISRQKLIDYLNNIKLNKIIIIVTHDIDLIKIANKNIILE